MSIHVFAFDKEERKYGLITDFVNTLDEGLVSLIKKHPLNQLYKLKNTDVRGRINGFWRPDNTAVGKEDVIHAIFILVLHQNPSMDPELNNAELLVPLDDIEPANLIGRAGQTETGVWVKYLH